MPVMIHIGSTPEPLGDILNLLHPGDIATHAYSSLVGFATDVATHPAPRANPSAAQRGHDDTRPRRQVLPELRDALDRGVLLDVGHGMGRFS